MRYSLKSSILCKSQIGKQLWENYAEEDTNRARENIKQNNKILTKENLPYYKFKMDTQNYYVDQMRQAKLQ
jgi:hypothetical protein